MGKTIRLPQRNMNTLLEKLKSAKRETKKLGDIIGYIADNRGKNPSYYSESGIPVIDNFMITGKRSIDLGQTKRFINEAMYASFIRKEIRENDVLVTLVGNGFGNIGLAPKEKSVIIQNTIGLRANKFSVNSYIFYLLSLYKEKIIARDRGAAQPSIKVGDLLDIEINLPDLPTQKKIASILGAYDAKIENNNTIIKNLEATAQAIFKEWFVKLRFPGYEKVKMVESELGLIPEGWGVKKISDVATLNKGVSYSSPEISDKPTGLPLVNLKCFTRGGGFKLEGLKYYTGEFRKKHEVVPGQIVIALTDLTPTREVIGRPARIPIITGFNKILISLDVCSLQIKEGMEESLEFIYYTLRRREFGELMALSASGTTVAHLSATNIEDYEFVFPEQSIIKKFHDFIEEPFTLHGYLSVENQKLKASRDQLLKKLT